MNLANFALKKRTLMVVFTIMIIGIGILAFQKLGRLEDPTFTIKTALIVTQYPGANPIEVEEEVTNLIEESIKAMGQVKQIYSQSEAGISLVYVDMKDHYKSYELPQIWDELRRKVGDVRIYLPPGAGPSVVRDDFGDVYGVFFALHGENHSYAELKTYAKYLKKELLLCKDVAKINFWGTQKEAIYIEFKRARMAELGISADQIVNTIQNQNIVKQSGYVDVDSKYMRINPTGEFNSKEKIAELLINSNSGNQIRLGDIAYIQRNYIDPPMNIMRFNGKQCIGIGISTIDKGNVIAMGNSIKEKLKMLESKQPKGMYLDVIYYQSRIVTKSVDAFIINLEQAVAIVIILLMLFMGWRSGMLIGFILLLTILATFIGMLVMGIDLQKISLGALILSLGMLVDNAIVIADGILIRMEEGKKKEDAAMAFMDSSIRLVTSSSTSMGFAPGY